MKRCRICKNRLRTGQIVIELRQWHEQTHNEASTGLEFGWVHLTCLMKEQPE